MKELKEAVEKNNALREQVTRLSMDQNMGSALHHACSSGQETCESRTESLLLSTMSSWTLGTLNVPECVPAQGESEVDKRSYEYWKETLMASLQLVNSANEHAKYGVFKIKAGVKLREIFNTTVSSPTMPDERTHPFSNALARLDDYFGSRTYLLSQRGKLMNLCQSPTEKSVDFVRRVASTAKLCSYGENEEMEAVVRVITTGANDSRVRVLARRNWIKQGSMKDLIDLILDHEIERANEEEFQKTRQRNESGTIAAVSRGPQELQLQRQANFHGNWRGRGTQRGSRGFRGRARDFNRGMVPKQTGSNCWRCGSFFHRSFACPVADKVCHTCRRAGHIARMCTSANQQAQTRSWKRRSDSEDSEIPRKIAAIENKTEHLDAVPKVQEPDDNPE